MKLSCPYCANEFSNVFYVMHKFGECSSFRASFISQDKFYNLDDKKIQIEFRKCYASSCEKESIWACIVEDEKSQHKTRKLIYPCQSNRFIPKSVPNKYVKDYHEASKLKDISPNASAALSRRLLQYLLHSEFNIKKNTLSEEIKEFKKNTSTVIGKYIDLVRHIGNLAAHPAIDQNSGCIVEVEEEDAEALLCLIDEIFEEHFEKKYRFNQSLSSINQKHSQAGKKTV